MASSPASPRYRAMLVVACVSLLCVCVGASSDAADSTVPEASGNKHLTSVERRGGGATAALKLGVERHDVHPEEIPTAMHPEKILTHEHHEDILLNDGYGAQKLEFWKRRRRTGPYPEAISKERISKEKAAKAKAAKAKAEKAKKASAKAAKAKAAAEKKAKKAKGERAKKKAEHGQKAAKVKEKSAKEKSK